MDTVLNNDIVAFQDFKGSPETIVSFNDKASSYSSGEKFARASTQKNFNERSKPINVEENHYETYFYSSDIIADAFNTATELDEDSAFYYDSPPDVNQDDSVVLDGILPNQQHIYHSSPFSLISDPNGIIRQPNFHSPNNYHLQKDFTFSYYPKALSHPPFDEQDSSRMNQHPTDFDIDASDFLKLDKEFELSDFAADFNSSSSILEREFLTS